MCESAAAPFLNAHALAAVVTKGGSGMKGEHLGAVDALRFASALMVVAYHVGTGYPLSPSIHSAAALSGLAVPIDAIGWSWWGWVGVELFFTVSGVVIAASALGAPAGDFLARRALRLLPVAWIAATLTLALLLIAGVAPPETLLARWTASVLLWPTGPWIDASAWTLAIECAFYLLVATVLRGGGGAARIERLGVALTAWSAAFWAAYLFANPLGTALMHQRGLQLLLLPNGAQFALGIVIWALLHRGVTRMRVVVAAGAFAVSGVTIACHAAERAEALGVAGGALAPWLAFALATAALLAAARLQPRLERPRTRRVLAAMGLATYPLNLLHQDAGAVLLAAAMRAGLPGWAAALAAQALVLAAAFAIARHAEPWLRAQLRRAFGDGAQRMPWPRAR